MGEALKNFFTSQGPTIGPEGAVQPGRQAGVNPYLPLIAGLGGALSTPSRGGAGPIIGSGLGGFAQGQMAEQQLAAQQYKAASELALARAQMEQTRAHQLAMEPAARLKLERGVGEETADSYLARAQKYPPGSFEYEQFMLASRLAASGKPQEAAKAAGQVKQPKPLDEKVPGREKFETTEDDKQVAAVERSLNTAVIKGQTTEQLLATPEGKKLLAALLKRYPRAASRFAEYLQELPKAEGATTGGTDLGDGFKLVPVP